MGVDLNNVSLRQLRAFEAVARLGSFVAAAGEQCVTQSALSESIKQLENTLGLRLLDRTTRSVALSPAGVLFIEDVRLVLSTLRSSHRRLQDVRTLSSGEVRIAASPSVIQNIVMPAMVELLRRNPALRVTVRDEGAERIQALVKSGDVDFGVGGVGSDDQGLQRQLLLVDRFGLVAQAGHRLLGRRTLVLSDLGGEDFIGLTEDTAIAHMISALPDCPPNVLAPRALASNPAVMRQMIDAGIGVGLLPALVAMGSAYQSLAFKPLGSAKTPVLERKIWMLQRPHRSLTPASMALWQSMLRFTTNLRNLSGINVVV